MEGRNTQDRDRLTTYQAAEAVQGQTRMGILPYGEFEGECIAYLKYTVHASFCREASISVQSFYQKIFYILDDLPPTRGIFQTMN